MLSASVFDTLSITEDIGIVQTELFVNLFDSTSLADVVTISTGQPSVLYVSVNDEVSVTELVVVQSVAGIVIIVEHVTALLLI